MRAWPILVLVACSGRAPAPPPPPLVPLARTVTPASAEAAYDAKQWAECAAQWTQLAERAAGDAKAGALYDAACCYALDGRAGAALDALAAALDAGYWDAEHLAADEDLAAIRTHARWPALRARAEASFAAFERSLVEPQLRRELLALATRDQEARRALEDGGGQAARDAVTAIDREATARMKDVVAKHGWPGKRIVGADGANAAWMLVQHADADPAFQKACLAQMEPLVKTGDVAGQDYAYLWDRVARAEGRPQRYGTQFEAGELAPLEDRANVDARRRAVGLGPLAEYEAAVKQQQK